MHGRTTHPDPVGERLTLGVETRERGQERRVDVQDALGERIEQGLADEPHEPRQAHQVDTVSPQDLDDRRVVA